MKQALGLLVLLAVLTGSGSAAHGLGIPLLRTEGHWTVTDADQVQITGLLLMVVPSLDDRTGEVVWTIDETFVLRNYAQTPITLDLGVPNAWSFQNPDVSLTDEGFWAQAYVNGNPMPSEVVQVVMNPAHPQIAFRLVRHFQLTIEGDRWNQVRLQYALPAPTTETGARCLSYPFEIGALFDGPIETGVIVLRWTDPMFSFRSNLGAYSWYRDRAEWFLRAFEPSASLEIQFLPRTEVFRMVGEELHCPMPWEVMDRLSDGAMEAVRDMLEPYDSERLTMCQALPGTLLGSLADALEGGLSDLRLEQFAPAGSEISGPLFIPDPGYDPSEMSEAEAVYARVLRQEVVRRQAGP